MTAHINDGGAAFPRIYDAHGQKGMSLRDWFAGQALANPYAAHESCPIRVAKYAYEVADAMLSARKGGAQ